MFNDKIIEHYMCPQNAYYMVDADGEGEYRAVGCDDGVSIFIKVKDNIIIEISQVVFGCECTLATSSMLTVLTKGKTLEDALLITNVDIDNALDGLPDYKKHCIDLCIGALRYAIDDYIHYRDRKLSVLA